MIPPLYDSSFQHLDTTTHNNFLILIILFKSFTFLKTWYDLQMI